jgi:nucleoside-diphosphate-sugar epimerase
MASGILITGGAGYIGSVLVPVLLAEGYEVTVLDNFRYGQASLLDCCINERFSIIRGDCRHEDTMRKTLMNADIILPFAAMVGAPACENDRNAATSTNLEAIKLLLSLRSRSQKIFFPCTNSGYGIGEKDKFCTEETPLRPVSLYGRTKVEAERLILEAGDAISLRLATVFGVSPRMRVDLLVNDFVYRAVVDRYVIVFQGHFKRNYIHIRDVARAFIHAIKNFDRMKNEPYNVGLSEANLSKLELCAKIKEQVPDFVYMEAPIGEDPDKRDYIVSNEKIEKTGFKPVYSLEMGIKELIKGYAILRNQGYANI